jgi:hypothetical protein
MLSSKSYLCYLYETGLLLRLTGTGTPITINSKKKVCLVLLPLFTYDLGSEIRNPGSEIRNEKMFGSGSGIKHPESATLC